MAKNEQQVLLTQGKAFAKKIADMTGIKTAAPVPSGSTPKELAKQYGAEAVLLSDGSGHRALVLLDADAAGALGDDLGKWNDAVQEAAAALMPAGSPMAVEASSAADWVKILGPEDKPAATLAFSVTDGGKGNIVIAFSQAAGARAAELPELKPEEYAAHAGSIRHIEDIPLEITVEVGRATMPVREMLRIIKGSIIPLTKMAEDPVDIFVNGKLFAKGEIVVIDETFGVRVTEIIHQGVPEY
jgi:flagellar motor switch protein FliN